MDPFASLAEAYEAWYGTPLGAYVIAEEERALKGLLPPGESLLEVGAGTGYWLRRLPYPQKVGVEPSEAMLAVGRRRAPEATWVRAWGEALPFPGESFDVVLLFTTLEFVEDVERVTTTVLVQNNILQDSLVTDSVEEQAATLIIQAEEMMYHIEQTKEL